MLKYSLTLLACVLLLSLAGQKLPELPDYELDRRIQLSVDRLTELDRQPAFSHDFLLADVRLNPADPRRFYNFSGDLSGRYIEVMSLLNERQRDAVRLEELVRSVIAEQKADGRFGDENLRYTSAEIGGEHMALLWGNGRLLVGLMAHYERTGDQQSLAAARRLGDFFISTATACREPAIRQRLEGFGAKGIICFTQYIEGLAMLARATGADKYVQAAEDAYTILPGRGVQHSHGYLSTLRGVVLLYEITNDASQLAYVKQTFDDLLAADDHTIYGAVFEYFGGQSDHSDGGNKGNRDEGCSSADFVRLALDLHRVTGDQQYLDAGEKGLLNALYYNQYASGDFGHHYFDDGVIKAANPRRSWWCCTMHGLRGLLAVKESHAVRKAGQNYQVGLLLSQQYEDDIVALGITEKGGGRARYEVIIDRWNTEGTLQLPLPAWGDNWSVIRKGKALPIEAGAQTVTLADLQPAEKIVLSSDLRLSFHKDLARNATNDFPEKPTAGYLTYGPYVMGVNQESFIAEPDWANQIDLQPIGPASTAGVLSTRFRHAGYPGLNPVRLIPIGRQLYYGHPYMRVKTLFTTKIEGISPDE